MSTRTLASSSAARQTLSLVESLQTRLIRTLSERGGEFEPLDWVRDGGTHGGGTRHASFGDTRFDRASANVSQVHYDDLPDKRLASATALSTIFHPVDPRSPSMHMHISLTEMRSGRQDWRLMADLNPAIPSEEHRQRFGAALEAVAGPHNQEAVEQGDRYFYIPALERYRGVHHFYLERFSTGELESDLAMADAFGTAVTNCYASLLDDRPSSEWTDGERAEQVAYHTLYFFQVLTLDRGTTSGLLIHDQNDVGILASLPSRVDAGRLASWATRMPSPQHHLIPRLLDVLGATSGLVSVTEAHKPALAEALRSHYAAHPDGLALQASGAKKTSVVENHR